jgi:hypothetical protein
MFKYSTFIYFVIISLLTGCGASTEEKHVAIMKCASVSAKLIKQRRGLWIQALANLRENGSPIDPYQKFETRGQEYARSMDQSKLFQIDMEAENDSKHLIEKNDVAAIVVYLRNCMAYSD